MAMENTTNYANPNMGYTKKIKEYTNQITYTSFWKHTHTFYEIFIITHGEVTHYFNDIPKRLQTGDVVLMKANNTDYHYFKKATPVYEHWDLYINTYTFKYLCDMISPSFYSTLQTFDGLLITHAPSPIFETVVQLLKELFIIQDTHSSNLINSLHIPCASLLLGLFAKQYHTPQNTSLLEFNTFLAKMNSVKYICGPIDDIVKLSGYSHSYLCKIFKEQTGKTLKHYHNQLKINYAMELLKNKKLTILQISSTLGYNSLSHFIKLFKSYTALTPSEYRRQFIQENVKYN